MSVVAEPRGLTALVTGAASGIGLASATALADRGVHVVLADVDADAMTKAVARLNETSSLSRAHGVVADVATAEGARAAVEEAAGRYGRLDLLHLNAGRAGTGPLSAATDPDEAGSVIATNVMAVVATLVAALPHLGRSRAAAVTVTASLAGLVASPADPLYAASKHALVGLVRSVAPGHPDIRVNAVCPSLVDTPMTRSFLAPDLPVLDADEVARAVVDQLLGTCDAQILLLEAGSDPRVVHEPLLSRLQRPGSSTEHDENGS